MTVGEQRRLDKAQPALGAVDVSSAKSILVVDAPEANQILSSADPKDRSIVYTHWRSLNAAMLSKIAPQAILAPLICMSFDIVDLGATLQSLGFCGDLYVITRPLPRAELVVQEVNAVCPALTVHLLEVA